MTITQTPNLVARERQAATELMKLGLPYVSTMAAVANAVHESLVQPVNASSDGSDGLWQWRDASDVHRLSAMKDWCAAHNLDWRTIAAQCAYFLFEVKVGYPALYADLVGETKPLATLTANIETFFERPASLSDLDARIATAQWLFDNLKDLQIAPVPAPVVPPVVPVTPPAPASKPSLADLEADAAAKRLAVSAALAAYKAAVAKLSEALAGEIGDVG